MLDTVKGAMVGLPIGTTGLTPGILAINILFLIGIYICYNAFIHPLAGYHGPKFRAMSRVPYILGMISGQQHTIFRQLHEQYGSVVRVAPDKLSYISAEAWREIYGHKKVSEPEMGEDEKWFVADPNAQHIIFSTRERHAHFRRLFSHGFSDRTLRAQEPLLRDYVDLLIGGLEQHAQKGSVATGPGRMNAALHPWVRDMFQAIKGIMHLRACQEIPVIGPYIPTLLRRVLFTKALKKRAQHLAFTREKVTRRVNREDHRPDFMENILQQPEGKGLTFPEMLSNSSVLVMAGSETTATLLSGATYLLLTNPDKMQKLRDELIAAFRNADEITIEAANRLVYLLAVIEESLRFYPPVAVGLPRVVPAGGSLIEDRFVPAGISVTVSHFAAYRSGTNFHRPDEFIPERFLSGSDCIDKRDVLQPFSLGPRNCIGMNLAYAEAKLILARVIFTFDMKMCDSSKGWMDQNTYAIWEKHPLNVYLTPRAMQYVSA